MLHRFLKKLETKLIITDDGHFFLIENVGPPASNLQQNLPYFHYSTAKLFSILASPMYVGIIIIRKQKSVLTSKQRRSIVLRHATCQLSSYISLRDWSKVQDPVVRGGGGGKHLKMWWLEKT